MVVEIVVQKCTNFRILRVDFWVDAELICFYELQIITNKNESVLHVSEVCVSCTEEFL